MTVAVGSLLTFSCKSDAPRLTNLILSGMSRLGHSRDDYGSRKGSAQIAKANKKQQFFSNEPTL